MEASGRSAQDVALGAEDSLPEVFRELKLGGSWDSYKWVIIRVTMLITPIRGLITPFIANHEPRSKGSLTGALKEVPLEG